jgi:raffinose/stachyose/melibiose transport system permease protein
MMGPAVALVTVFVLVPIVVALYLSLTDWNGFSFPPNWLGLENYRRLITDPEAGHALAFTATITVVGTLLLNVLGLGVAILLNRNDRVTTFLRVLVFYPFVIGPVVLGFLWGSILGSNGAINSVLESFGADRLPFLADPQWAKVTVIAVIVWSGFGLNVVLYLAGLQTINESLIEAARIDGANAWQTFWRVKLPLLAPIVTVNIAITVIGMIKAYEVILALTAGGPAGTTQTVVFNIISTSFSRSQLGYGAAQSIVLMLVIVIATVAITRMRRSADEGASG